MYDEDKSMEVHWIYNQSVGTKKTLQGINPVVLSATWDDSIGIIAFKTLKINCEGWTH